MKEPVAPTIEKAQTGKCKPHDLYRHPAYGTVTLTHPTGGNSKMFGSDVGHMGTVRIEIKHAELHRDLSRDWIHGHQPILCFEMTHSQFAAFITGVGKGEGTPVTLKYAAPGQAEEIPQIAWKANTQDLFRAEIKTMAGDSLDEINKGIAQLKEMVETNTITKTRLKAIVHDMEIRAQNAPSNMAFVVKSAEEALEKATDHAKIEVEAFIDARTKALGLQSLEQLVQIESPKLEMREGQYRRNPEEQ